jgi:hypothetical protein
VHFGWLGVLRIGSGESIFTICSLAVLFFPVKYRGECVCIESRKRNTRRK